MTRLILFVAIAIATNHLFAQGPSTSPFAKSTTINYISKFRASEATCKMPGSKIKVRERIVCFDFEAEVGEWVNVKRFQVKNGKFLKKGHSKLKLETGVPFSPMEYGNYIILISRKNVTKNRVLRIKVAESGYEVEKMKVPDKKTRRISFQHTIDKLLKSEIPDFKKSTWGNVKWKEKLKTARVSVLDIKNHFSESSVQIRTFYQANQKQVPQQLFNSPCESPSTVQILIPATGIYWLEAKGESGTYIHRVISKNQKLLHSNLFLKERRI